MKGGRVGRRATEAHLGLATTLERAIYPTATPPGPPYPLQRGSKERHFRTGSIVETTHPKVLVIVGPFGGL